MDEFNFDSSTHLQAATSWLSAYENGEEKCDACYLPI